MYRLLLMLCIVATLGGCGKSADAPDLEAAKPAADGLVPGTMEVVSVEPVKLLPLSEVNLLSGGDFHAWKFGTPRPAGFTLPNEQFSTLARESAAEDAVVLAVQTWLQADTPKAVTDHCRA